MENLTIGSIWQSKKSGKEFRLEAQNGAKIQLANSEGYTIMTQKSLRVNYRLISLKQEPKVEKNEPVAPQPTAEPVENTAKTIPEISPEHNYVPRKPRAYVEMPDGKVLTGKQFIIDIAHKTEAETCKGSSTTQWLMFVKAGRELLAQYNGKIVYKK